jgi:hypothetical protein
MRASGRAARRATVTVPLASVQRPSGRMNPTSTHRFQRLAQGVPGSMPALASPGPHLPVGRSASVTGCATRALKRTRGSFVNAVPISR